MTPAARDLPIVEARFDEVRRRWVIALPAGEELVARDAIEIEELVRLNLPGSAIRWSRASSPRT